MDEEKKKQGRPMKEPEEDSFNIRGQRSVVPAIIPEDAGATVSKKPYKFSPKHMKFLDVYSETLDFSQAKRESGLRTDVIMKNRHLSREMKYIEEMAALRYRNKVAIGTHQRLMKKFEECHDGADDPKIAATYARTLASMSDAAMRAAGEYHDHGTPKVGNAVQVVINVGKPEEAECIEVSAEDVQIVREDGDVD